MTIPRVNITELDGALGVLPSGARYPAFVGDAQAGSADVPAGYGSITALKTAFTGGAMPDIAARFIAAYGRPAVCVRTGVTDTGAYGTVDSSGKAGTSVVTATASTYPTDDFEAHLEVVAGGTVGTAGITYRWSLDDARTQSPVTALGTATTLAFPAGGVSLSLAAGTLVAGDIVRVRTTGPQPDAADITTALTALKQSALPIDCVVVCAPLDGTLFDAVDTAIAGFFTAGKPVYWMGSFRIPDVDETEADYAIAFAAAFGSRATTAGAVVSGSCAPTSSLTGRAIQRSALWALAPLQASVDDHINIAELGAGLIAGVSLADSLGNPLYHDEYLNPGLDDARSMVLRTWADEPGTYCNRPRLLSSASSDYQLIPHRRVANVARRTLAQYFRRRLSKPIQVDAVTGYILESEAIEIENGAHNALVAVLGAAPKVSGGGFPKGRFVQLSRTDNLLSTKTMTVAAKIIPLAYPETVNVELGFYNPALQLVSV